jgi:hypothetical protein
LANRINASFFEIIFFRRFAVAANPDPALPSIFLLCGLAPVEIIFLPGEFLRLYWPMFRFFSFCSDRRLEGRSVKEGMDRLRRYPVPVDIHRLCYAMLEEPWSFWPSDQ